MPMKIDFGYFAKKKYRKLLDDYEFFLKIGRRTFCNRQLSTHVRLEKLRLLEKAIRKECPLRKSVVARLQKFFVRENLSISLLLEPLSAWKYLAEEKFPSSELQLSDVLNIELSPAARLIMVLNNENPSTYFPMSSLLLLREMQKLIAENDDLLKKAKISVGRRLSIMRGLHKNASVILALVHKKKLKFRLALALNFAKIHTEKYTRYKHFSLGVLDCAGVVLYSIWQFLTVKRRSVTKKGI